MNNIKIETKGIILSGEFKDWNIFIEDLDKGQGAYLIVLTSPNKAMGYDDWVENYENLEGYFKEVAWKIHWVLENI